MKLAAAFWTKYHQQWWKQWWKTSGLVRNSGFWLKNWHLKTCRRWSNLLKYASFGSIYWYSQDFQYIFRIWIPGPLSSLLKVSRPGPEFQIQDLKLSFQKLPTLVRPAQVCIFWDYRWVISGIIRILIHGLLSPLHQGDVLQTSARCSDITPGGKL